MLSNGVAQTPKNDKQHYSKVKDFNPKDSLYAFFNEDSNDSLQAGFLNSKGDTVIPFGKYDFSWTMEFVTYAFVSIITDSSALGTPIAINRKGERIFDMYVFDNGPDDLVEGLMRIKQNGKIGFADSTGRIVIRPKYQCAYPFENGQAQVTKHCSLIPNGEYHSMSSSSWFYIDKKGRKVKVKNSQ